MKEADFYQKLKDKKVRCLLCPRKCVIGDGERGFCMVRKNEKGKLYSLNYMRPCSVAVDPIEKKPLFHFAPGTQCVSISTVGCNLACRHCQNWQISREFGEITGEEVPPENYIRLAKDYGSPGFAYTYTEPTIFFEYALEIMKLAKKNGMYNVWVTNGYTSPEAVGKMAKYLDAVNVDIKGNDSFYRKVSMAPQGIKPVLGSLKEYKRQGIWIEVTNLIIPMYNDSEKDIGELVGWVIKNLGKEVPLHFSAFFPSYKLRDAKPTPASALEAAVRIAREKGVKWTYAGNVRGNEHESTFCHKCGTKVIGRNGFEIVSYSDRCPKCGTPVLIKGKEWMR